MIPNGSFTSLLNLAKVTSRSPLITSTAARFISNIGHSTEAALWSDARGGLPLGTRRAQPQRWLVHQEVWDYLAAAQAQPGLTASPPRKRDAPPLSYVPHERRLPT